MKNEIYGIVIMLLCLSFAPAKEYKQLKSSKDLNDQCKENIVYNMEVIDPVLLKGMHKYTLSSYTNFLLRKKIKTVGLYEFGCVSDSLITSCTHSLETNIFFVNGNDIYMLKSNANKTQVSRLLQELTKKNLLTESDVETFEIITDEIISKNQRKKFEL